MTAPATNPKSNPDPHPVPPTPVSEAHSSRALYLRLLGYSRPYWKAIVASLVATAVMASTEPIFAALMKPFLDQGFSKEGQGFSQPILIPLAIIVIFIVRGGFNYFSSYGFSWVANRVIMDVRNEMYERLVHLPVAYFQRHASSIPLTKIAYDVQNVASAATSVIVTLMKDGLTVIGLLIVLFWLNWQLTLICFALIPCVALVIGSFSGRLRRASRAAQTGTATMVKILQETAHCNRIIKIFGGETQEVRRFLKSSNTLRQQNMRQAIAAAAGTPLVQFFAALAVAAIVYMALLQSADGKTTVGGFVSFITAMLMLLAPLKHLSDLNGPLQRGLAAAESVFQLLDEIPEVDRGTVDLGAARGEIEFSEVRFSYPGSERSALDGVTLSIEAGGTLALVGPSGGGKSTLAALVPRFFSPDAGAVRLDGHDIETLTLESLRRNIAYVSQDVLLFDDTVAANIAYGSPPDLPREEIERAAQAANALDFIRALPQGFDTLIGENGTRLSGGQRQRLAIARAILKNAPVLILDEATSALDNESERLVQAALERLMVNRTTLVVAHRLSTIEGADRIAVLAHGRVVEVGKHDELLQKGGAYAQLYKLQFAQLDM